MFGTLIGGAILLVILMIAGAVYYICVATSLNYMRIISKTNTVTIRDRLLALSLPITIIAVWAILFMRSVLPKKATYV